MSWSPGPEMHQGILSQDSCVDDNLHLMLVIICNRDDFVIDRMVQ